MIGNLQVTHCYAFASNYLPKELFSGHASIDAYKICQHDIYRTKDLWEFQQIYNLSTVLEIDELIAF